MLCLAGSPGFRAGWSTRAERICALRSIAVALARSREPARAAGIRQIVSAMVALAAAGIATPSFAQVAVEGSLSSDYRVRGYSMSGGNPVAALSLSYDHPTGFYLGATAVTTIRDGEPEIAAVQGAAGYALRLDPDVSVDAGVSRSHYRHVYNSYYDLNYTELYLGVSVPHFTARVNYSPDYSAQANSTLYAEAEMGFEPAQDWSLSAHVGLFSYLGASLRYLPNERYDWRVGASRRFGGTTVDFDVSGRLQGKSAGFATDSEAVVLRLAHAF